MNFFSRHDPERMHDAISFFMDACCANGVDGDIIVEDSRRLSFRIDSADYLSEKTAHELCCSLRITKQGHVAYAYTPGIDKNRLKSAIRLALDSFSSEKILSVTPYHEVPIKIQSTESHGLEAGDLKATLNELNTSGPNTFCPSRGKTITSVHRIFQTTTGTIVDKVEKSFMYYTSACDTTTRRRITSELEFFSKDRNAALITMKNCIDSHLAKKRKVKVSPHLKYELIFSPSVIAELLNCNSFFFLPSHDSFISKPKINWDSRINLYEVSGFEGSLVKNEIDFEGTPKSDICIIKEGKVTQFLHNRQTAVNHLSSSTGNAIRPLKGKIGVGASLFSLEAGNDSKSDLYQGEYLYITSVKGQYGLINGVGNILCEGFLVNNRKTVGVFDDFQFYFNFCTLFEKVIAIGNKLFTSKQKDIQTPEIRISP